MVNVNRTLIEDISPYLWEYGCEPQQFDRLLAFPRSNFSGRQRAAVGLVHSILEAHGKQDLFSYLAELAKVESGIRQLEPWVRDHVVHALLSFILGIYINERIVRVRTGAQISPLQWKLAGMLHDIGYPPQIAQDVVAPLTAKINSLRRAFGARIEIRFQMMPVGLERLSHRVNGLDLIQLQLDKWRLTINAHAQYRKMVRSGHICHGIISSLAVLNVIDAMYDKYNPQRLYEHVYSDGSHINWNQEYFDSDIVPACSAIFVHNLDHKAFADSKISMERAPLAYLLKLSDCLQEWERPKRGNPMGYSATRFDLSVIDAHLSFTAKIPDDRKKDIRTEVLLCLDNPPVDII